MTAVPSGWGRRVHACATARMKQPAEARWWCARKASHLSPRAAGAYAPRHAAMAAQAGGAKGPSSRRGRLQFVCAPDELLSETITAYPTERMALTLSEVGDPRGLGTRWIGSRASVQSACRRPADPKAAVGYRAWRPLPGGTTHSLTERRFPPLGWAGRGDIAMPKNRFQNSEFVPVRAVTRGGRDDRCAPAPGC
jgi:hypothetical protein